MDGAARLGEPVVDRHEERRGPAGRQPRRRAIGPSFFTLSGGILKRDPRTSDRVDSTLKRMLEEDLDQGYSLHVDKNLDYLHTCLQLDMISMAAQDHGGAEGPLEDRASERP